MKPLQVKTKKILKLFKYVRKDTGFLLSFLLTELVLRELTSALP